MLDILITIKEIAVIKSSKTRVVVMVTNTGVENLPTNDE